MTFFYTSVDLNYNDILFRGYRDGKRVKNKIKYKPSLYLESRTETQFKTLNNKFVYPKKFDSIKEARDFTKQYKDVSGFPIYGNRNYIHQFISELNDHKKITFDRYMFDIGTIDIEVAIGDDGFPFPSEAKQPIITISYHSSIEKVYMCWGLYDYDPTKSLLKNINIKYIKCDNEVDLLIKFLDYWRFHTPDILTGWNSDLFDTTYLVNRITKVLSWDVAKSLSPWNIIHDEVEFENNQQHQKFNIVGIQQIDYLKLFKKFDQTYGNQETYKLDHIAYVVLNENKMDYSEYKNLTQLYKENYQLFCDYNIKDSYLVDRFEDKLNLFMIVMSIAFSSNVNLEEAFSPVNVWDAKIYNRLKAMNIVIPPKMDNIKNEKIIGAFVKEPDPIKYGYVVSEDLNSLYPRILVQYNMSTETLIDKHQRYKLLLDELNKRGLKYEASF